MSELHEVRNVEEAQKTVQELLLKQTQMQATALNVKTALNKDYKQLDDLVSDIGKQKKELNRLLQSLRKFEKLPGAQKEEIEKLQKQVSPVRDTLNSLHRQNAPETGSVFVRLFLGQVNVKQFRDGERLRLKQEYEKFKRKTNPQFMLFIILLYIFPQSGVLITFWQIWLLYYYTTLALREHILKVNGSSIKIWWILHHYLSITASLTMLLWPSSSEAFSTLLHIFTHFGCVQGLVQILINRYQQGQLYKLVAMGKANMMDVAGEAEGWISDLGWTPSAMFLLPFLLFVQIFQLYISYALFLVVWEHNPWSHWQCFINAFVFLILGIGNLVTTINTYYQKFQQKQKNGKNKTN